MTKNGKIIDCSVTEWFDYPHYGMARYRIWLAKTTFGAIQRHEWVREDGSTEMQDWIKTTCDHLPSDMPVCPI